VLDSGCNCTTSVCEAQYTAPGFATCLVSHAIAVRAGGEGRGDSRTLQQEGGFTHSAAGKLRVQSDTALPSVQFETGKQKPRLMAR
jgi:hypothetical protein